jgi:hypothetical protein
MSAPGKAGAIQPVEVLRDRQARAFVWIDERLKLDRFLLRSPPHVVGFHAAGRGRVMDLQFIP